MKAVDAKLPLKWLAMGKLQYRRMEVEVINE